MTIASLIDMLYNDVNRYKLPVYVPALLAARHNVSEQTARKRFSKCSHENQIKEQQRQAKESVKLFEDGLN